MQKKVKMFQTLLKISEKIIKKIVGLPHAQNFRVSD